MGRLESIRPAHAFFHILVDFIFPPFCLLCEARLSSVDGLICPRCDQELPLLDQPLKSAERLDAHTATELHFSHSFAVFEFSDAVQQLIHDMKYHNMSRLGFYLGKRMAQRMPEDLVTSIDAVVPVPLHPVRYRERGFNQSEMLAQGMSKHTGIPVLPNAIKRIRQTEQQAKFDRQARMANVSGAFSVQHPESLSGLCIALVDDVMTTGSTLNECAKCLLDAGAIEVIAFSVVRI